MKKKKNHKQIAAIICLILILLSYIASFIVSLTDSSKSGELFQACLIATVFLPILCWIYIWLYGQVKQKHTIADLDILQTKEQTNNLECESPDINANTENEMKPEVNREPQTHQDKAPD